MDGPERLENIEKQMEKQSKRTSKLDRMIIETS